MPIDPSTIKARLNADVQAKSDAFADIRSLLTACSVDFDSSSSEHLRLSSGIVATGRAVLNAQSASDPLGVFECQELLLALIEASLDHGGNDSDVTANIYEQYWIA